MPRELSLILRGVHGKHRSSWGPREERKQMGLIPTRILVSVPLGEFSWCKEADTHCLKERRGAELRPGYGWVGRRWVLLGSPRKRCSGPGSKFSPPLRRKTGPQPCRISISIPGPQRKERKQMGVIPNRTLASVCLSGSRPGLLPRGEEGDRAAAWIRGGVERRGSSRGAPEAVLRARVQILACPSWPRPRARA